MKLLVFSCLVAASLAAPQNLDRDAVILLDERDDQGYGNFNYRYETSNGIYEERQGQPGVEGQSNMQGSYRFTFPDGSQAEVTFVADENGFVAQSPLIPTPHPLPDHVYELLRIADEQRAAGITFT